MGEADFARADRNVLGHGAHHGINGLDDGICPSRAASSRLVERGPCGAGRANLKACLGGPRSTTAAGRMCQYDRAAANPTRFAPSPSNRGRQIRRRLVLGEVRRHPCAVHRLGGGPRPALAQRPGARLDHRRIRHAAALDPYAHRPRGHAPAAGRAHGGDPAADRPQPARGGRPRSAGRAPDHHRLRRAPGRRRHPHRVDHRRLGGAARCLNWEAAGHPPVPLATTSPPFPAASTAERPVLDLDYAEIRPPIPTPISCSPEPAASSRSRARLRARRSREPSSSTLLALARKGIGSSSTCRRWQ